MTRPLIIVCDWIPPAFGAVGQYQLAKAKEAARAGRPTTIIGLGNEAGIEHEFGASAPLTVVRLAARPTRKSSLIRRAIWALGTNARLLRATLRALKRDDGAELKVTGSPPFLAYLVIAANALFLRRTLTYRITDFYPETAIAAGKGAAMKPFLPFFHWLRRRATTIEVLSECQKRRLIDAGIPGASVSIVRDGSPVDFSSSPSALPSPFAEDKVVILYSGNLGVAHDIDTFAEAYRQHVRHGPDRVRLWLNATGVKVPKLVEFCRQNDLPIHVTPPASLDRLASLLVSPAAHLVTLEQPFWGYVIPSKIYACIDSNKPVLYIGPVESDLHELVSLNPRSVSVRNRDVEACRSALDRLASAFSGTSESKDDYLTHSST